MTKTEGKRSLERPKHGCEDNIEMNFKDVILDGVDWVYLTQGRDK
jgi:hypothetical protein